MSSRLGVPTKKIEALNDYANSPLFTEAEKAALEYADAITDAVPIIQARINAHGSRASSRTFTST